MKKSVVLLILLVGLVGFAVMYQGNRERRMNSARLTGVPMREYLLPELPVSEVRKIRVGDESIQVNLTVQGDRWVVEERAGYPAAFEKISRLVSELAELKITGKNEVGATALKELMLEIPVEGGDSTTTGLQVELFNEKGEVLSTMVIGDSTRTSGGASSGNWMGGVEQRYVRIPKDQDTVWLIKDTVTDWTPQPEQWLSKSFIDVVGIRVIEVKSANGQSGWKLERDSEEVGLTLVGAAGGEKLDEGIASRAGMLLSNVLFTDVHAKEKAAELLKEALSVKIITFDGFVYDVRLAAKQGGEGQEGEAAYYLSFTVKNDIPKARPVAPNETAEEKKAKDEQFAAAVKETAEKLEREKGFEGWVYEVGASAVDFLLRDRAGLLAPKQEGAPAQGGGGMPGGMGIPQLPGFPGN